MSAISLAMSGVKPAAAKADTSAQNTANLLVRIAAPRGDAAPPANPAATPAPKVYRPMRANLYSLSSNASGGAANVRYQQITPGYYLTYEPKAPEAEEDGMIAAPPHDRASKRLEQIQAAVHYRLSMAALQTADDMQAAAVDVIA